MPSVRPFYNYATSTTRARAVMAGPGCGDRPRRGMAGLVSTLVLTDPFTPRGTVFGSFQRCESCPQGHALHPQADVPIKFVRVGSNREYVAVTNSMGDYSVSLPAGHYLIGRAALYLVAVGPHDVTVIAGQPVEADFIAW